MAHPKLIRAANRITELSNTLENVCHDDGIKLEAMDDSQLVSEARHVLSLFLEGGTCQSEMLDSDDAEERAEARKQIRQLKRLIAQGEELLKLEENVRNMMLKR
jgi:hypothetical protein